nr:MAG TPA: hypothetical protein [Caudoviricetes sp.]DAT88370.1 MAG TPA: hypothetical protein [Caudoviricetes sp.]DAV99903.1 MAG TPA: hypothetical protein [Caudoviricetes sp.]
MAEFASKGIAGTGLGLGIAGTALSLLNGNGGGLGGILGGNNCASVIAEKDAKIAELTAQKYSDNQDAVLYQATRAENKNLRDEVFAYVTPIAQEAASNRERVAVLEAKQACDAEAAALREKLVRAELGAKIDGVAQTCGCGISQLNNAVAAINTTLGAITQTVIPKSAICPEVMSRYNSWTAPTAAATNEG